MVFHAEFNLNDFDFRSSKEELGTTQKTSRALHTEASFHELHRYNYATNARLPEDSSNDGELLKSAFVVTIFLYQYQFIKIYQKLK